MPDESLLIIHQGALGDFILTFPAFTRLQKYYKPIDVLCQNQQGQLAKTLGLADNWYPSEAAYFSSLFSTQVDPKIKAILAQYENIILFTWSEELEQSIKRVTANVRCRISPQPPARRRIHVTEFVLENIANGGLIAKEDATLDATRFAISEDHPRDFKKILLHPGAGSIRKRWPVSGFIQVEIALEKAGLKPEFILGPADKNLTDALQGPGRPVHLPDNLPELVVLLRSAGGYIGNDSGASHLAAYIGLSTAVIFGPADPQRWAPVGRAVQIVRPSLQCRPCFETEPANCDDPQCLAGIDPQKVMEAFYSVYFNPDPPAAENQKSSITKRRKHT